MGLMSKLVESNGMREYKMRTVSRAAATDAARKAVKSGKLVREATKSSVRDAVQNRLQATMAARASAAAERAAMKKHASELRARGELYRRKFMSK